MISITYVAGLFDGEGWISISRNKPNVKHGQKNVQYHCRVGIEMTDLAVLKDIQERFGGNIYSRGVCRSPNHKETHTLYWDSLNALSFLKKIKRHLRIKQRQSLIGISYINHVQKYMVLNKNYRLVGLSKETLDFRESCVQQIRALNASHGNRRA